jgi:hypothetical protein
MSCHKSQIKIERKRNKSEETNEFPQNKITRERHRLSQPTEPLVRYIIFDKWYLDFNYILKILRYSIYKSYCTMLYLFDDLWLDKIIPKYNDRTKYVVSVINYNISLFRTASRSNYLIIDCTLLQFASIVIFMNGIFHWSYCTMLYLFDDLWLDKIIPKYNDRTKKEEPYMEI